MPEDPDKGRSAVDRLVDHVVAARFTDLDPRAVEKAKIFLLDTLGVGIAGSAGAAIDDLRATVAAWGRGDEATVWATGERLPAQLAAIVNSYQIHCLEYDCVHEGAVVHPMATVLSATMAHAERRAAEGRPVDGARFLLALAVGVDVATLLGVAATGPVRFFRPATAGGFGAAAALAKLDGLGATEVKNTFGAVYGQTSGTLQPHVEGSTLLGLQIGFNARAALCALDLAAAGIRGPHDVIDGPYGYLRLFENEDYDLAPALAKLGREWQVTQLAHKPFPSGRLTHGVIDALMRLTREHGFGADDVARIHGRVPPLVYRLVGRPDIPEPDANYAKLCLRFVAGVWLARGRVDVPEFQGAETLRDEGVHRCAALVELEQDDNPDENALDPQTFSVELKGGGRHAVTLQHVYGHPSVPMTGAENEAKFRRCVGYGRAAMSQRQADAIVDTVAGLETEHDVSVLSRLTVVDV